MATSRRRVWWSMKPPALSAAPRSRFPRSRRPLQLNRDSPARGAKTFSPLPGKKSPLEKPAVSKIFRKSSRCGGKAAAKLCHGKLGWNFLGQFVQFHHEETYSGRK